MPITPDTKDWTWVLNRPCPDCGYDTSTFEPAEVAAMIRANGAAWPQVLERIDVRERPDADTWSPLEYAAHVRDVIRLMDSRIGMMLETDDPTYPNWDQDETAVRERYREQDPATVSAELQGLRRTDSPRRWMRCLRTRGPEPGAAATARRSPSRPSPNTPRTIRSTTSGTCAANRREPGMPDKRYLASAGRASSSSGTVGE